MDWKPVSRTLPPIVVAATCFMFGLTGCGDETEDAAKPVIESSTSTSVAAGAGSDLFCEDFNTALAVRNERLAAWSAQFEAALAAAPAGELPEDFLSTTGTLAKAGSEATSELLQSLRPPLPPEVDSAVERAIEIEQVYVSGAIPPEEEVEEVIDLLSVIVEHVNSRCGLDLSPSEI